MENKNLKNSNDKNLKNSNDKNLKNSNDKNLKNSKKTKEKLDLKIIKPNILQFICKLNLKGELKQIDDDLKIIMDDFLDNMFSIYYLAKSTKITTELIETTIKMFNFSKYMHFCKNTFNINTFDKNTFDINTFDIFYIDIIKMIRTKLLHLHVEKQYIPNKLMYLLLNMDLYYIDKNHMEHSNSQTSKVNFEKYANYKKISKENMFIDHDKHNVKNNIKNYKFNTVKELVLKNITNYQISDELYLNENFNYEYTDYINYIAEIYYIILIKNSDFLFYGGFSNSYIISRLSGKINLKNEISFKKDYDNIKKIKDDKKNKRVKNKSNKLNQTDQTDQTDQTNKTDQTDQIYYNYTPSYRKTKISEKPIINQKIHNKIKNINIKNYIKCDYTNKMGLTFEVQAEYYLSYFTLYILKKAILPKYIKNRCKLLYYARYSPESPFYKDVFPLDLIKYLIYLIK